MAYTNIDDPSAYFQTATYTGGGGGSSVTNDGNSNLKPDLVWFATREGNNKPLIDSSRGGNRFIYSDLTQGADVNTDGVGIATFDTDGFTFGSTTHIYFNNTSKTYVAWQWKANGGTTASNSDGSLTSTVQANTTAGFSIVGYTCPNPITNFTIGHGLGVTPDVIIVKTRDGSRNWGVYHKSLTSPAENRNLKLNLTNAEAAESSFWANTAPTSSVITIAQNASVNYQGHNYIAYCFAEKQGYSKFGKYVGNGNANGAFVYTGFKPAMVITKKISATGNWTIYDNKRDLFNVADTVLLPNTTNADQTVINFDFVSNGFKCRNSGSENESGTTYIYMAFAENPFVTSTGIPTTAR